MNKSPNSKRKRLTKSDHSIESNRALKKQESTNALLSKKTNSASPEKKRNAFEIMAGTKMNSKRPRNINSNSEKDNQSTIKETNNTNNTTNNQEANQEGCELKRSKEANPRALAREKFISALSLSKGILDPVALGTEIEREFFTANEEGKSSTYKLKLMTLLFNLKDPKNEELRASVLSGEITPSRLCRMSSQEMATSHMKEWRKQTEESFTKASLLVNEEENCPISETFRCDKCGARKTHSYQQTRPKDKAMTSYLTCSGCGYQWKP